MSSRSVAPIAREIGVARRSLRTFDLSLRRLVPLLTAATRNGMVADHPLRRSRSNLSPGARASMVLQGRYMGYIRQLKPRQKAQVRRIREAKEVRVAIVRAREMSRNSRTQPSTAPLSKRTWASFTHSM